MLMTDKQNLKKQPRCRDCDAEVKQAGDMCLRCTQDHIDEMQGDTVCAYCRDEGVIFDCIDGQCIDAESGCDLCAQKCDHCN